jgi:hypothetical protein
MERKRLFEWSDLITRQSRLKADSKTVQARFSRLRKEVSDGKRASGDPEYLAEQEKLKKLEEELEKAKEAAAAAGGDVSILLPLPGYEALPAGTQIRHRFDARGVSPVELGLLVAGLSRWAMDPRIGARVAHGCGEVSGRYRIKVRPMGTAAWKDDGSLSFDLLDGLTTDGKTLSQAKKAWDDVAIDYKDVEGAT